MAVVNLSCVYQTRGMRIAEAERGIDILSLQAISIHPFMFCTEPNVT